MKKQNDRCPLQQECERTCKVIGHERDCDYYVNNRYCTEGIPDQDELLAEEELRQEREREERYLASLSAEPEEPVIYQNEYGTLFAVRKHKSAPALMCKAKGADRWTLSGVLAAVKGEAYTTTDLQEVLDEYARAHGWQKAEPEKTREAYSPCESCRCPDCEDEDCPQAHCDKSDMGLGCIAPDGLCPPENPTHAAADAPLCAPTVSDAQPLPSPNADAGAKTGADGEVAACACYGCKRSDCTCAGGRDVFGRSDCDGHCNCSQSECTHDIRHRANPTPAAPASRADAGAAEQGLSAAGPASLAAKDTNVPTFDYSELDVVTVDTLHLAESIIRSARQKYIVDLAGAVDMAHEELVRNSDGHNQHTEETFVAWCRSVGISKTTAYQLLQVQALLTGSTPEEQATLEAASPSLLYAAAKPSAPAELVQAVKDGDITTHKQYQDALAEIRARDAKIKDLLEMSEAADRRADAAQAERDAADARARAAEKERDEACKERDGAKSALQASKLRGDRLKAENDDLKARPIEVPAVDEEEIDRRVNARLQQVVYASQKERRQIDARNAEDAILLLGRQINTAWQMVRPFLAEMEDSRRVEAIDRINREWAQTQKEIMQCL